MKRILLDANIVLDVLLDREPHVAASAAVWRAIEKGQVEGFLAAHAVTTIHYLIAKQLGPAKAKALASAILRVMQIAEVDSKVIQQAMEWSWPDFEDAVTAATALAISCDAIVTRDPVGFRRSAVKVLSPEEAASVVASSRR